MKSLIRWCALSSLALWVISCAYADTATTTVVPLAKLFDPEHQRPITSQNEGVKVVLRGSPGAFNLEIQSESGQKRLVALPDTFAQVDSIEWPTKGRIAVLGMVNGDGGVVGLVNPITAAVEDVFFGYEITISPNKRYVAFAKYFAPHAGYENTEDQVRYYDLTLAPASNRPIRSREPLFEAGVPVYPMPDKDGTMRSNVDTPPSDAYDIASEFRWSEDSKEFVVLLVHGGYELKLLQAVPGGPVSIADISRMCSTHCQFVTGKNLEFSSPQDGITFDLVGFGQFVGARKHEVIKNQELSRIAQKDGK